MDRIYHSTASATPPPIEISGISGHFRVGSPGGTTSTVVTATWAEGIQEEIVTVINAADIELDVADNTQLLDAIRFLIAEYVDAQNFIPTGAIMWRAAASAPTGWLYANGAAISRTAYADLFAAIGTTFGAGNNTTTFNLPNLKHRFVRGYDPADTFGESLADQIKAHNHTVTLAEAGAYTATLTSSTLSAQAHALATSSAAGAYSNTLTASTLAAQSHPLATSNSAGGISTQTVDSGEAGGHGHSVGVGSNLSGNQTANHTHFGTTVAAGAHTHELYENHSTASYDTIHTPMNPIINIGNGILPGDAYFGSGWTQNSGYHSHTITTGNNSGNHQHVVSVNSVPAHFHPIFIPAIPSHTHTVQLANHAAHGHTVPISIAAHTHTVQIANHAAHSHTVPVSIPTHSHTATCDNYGIATETMPKSVCLFPLIKV